MIIRHNGHAKFFLETESGIRIITDPYDSACGYPIQPVESDLVLVSHAHHDHNAVETLKGTPRIIDRAGFFTPFSGLNVMAVRGFHDDVQGTKRGETLLFLIETENLRIVHLGDIGCMVSEEQIRILHDPDVLMIPVGGFYTIDGDLARLIAKKLNARIILPMHYKTGYNADWPISGPDLFLKGFDTHNILTNAEALRITSGDLECHPQVVLFRQ